MLSGVPGDEAHCFADLLGSLPKCAFGAQSVKLDLKMRKPT